MATAYGTMIMQTKFLAHCRLDEARSITRGRLTPPLAFLPGHEAEPARPRCPNREPASSCRHGRSRVPRRGSNGQGLDALLATNSLSLTWVKDRPRRS